MHKRMVARHLLIVTLLAVLCVGLGASQPNPVAAGDDTDGPLQGDVTCDGAVDPSDGLEVLRGIEGLTESECLSSAGDVDCNLRIDVLDVLQIFRFSAGLSTGAPAGATSCSAIGATLVLPPSSEELIALALQAGDITYEQSLLYRAYGLFDHPRPAGRVSQPDDQLPRGARTVRRSAAEREHA